MKPIKLGIIGCGLAANDIHWPALQKMKDKFDITMVCNHTEQKAKQFAKLVGGAAYTLDYTQLLANPDIEAVDIILPIHLNYQVTKDALQAGKHVLLEKPLAANLTEAQKMLNFENQYPVIKMVAENYRYCATFLKVKEYIQKGLIGKPNAIFWNLYTLLNQSNKYVRTQWRIDHQYPGGFVTDCGVHYIAVLRNLFGEIACRTAFKKCINAELGELDSFSMQFNTTQNIAGVLNLFFSVHGHAENKMLIFGDKASLEIQVGKIITKYADKADIEELLDDDGGYYSQFENFFYAIKGKQKVVSTFSEAYKDLEEVLKALDVAQQI